MECFYGQWCVGVSYGGFLFYGSGKTFEEAFANAANFALDNAARKNLEKQASALASI
jgi:hypothetical protein